MQLKYILLVLSIIFVIYDMGEGIITNSDNNGANMRSAIAWAIITALMAIDLFS